MEAGVLELGQMGNVQRGFDVSGTGKWSSGSGRNKTSDRTVAVGRRL